MAILVKTAGVPVAAKTPADALRMLGMEMRNAGSAVRNSSLRTLDAGDNGLDESLLDMPGPVAVAGPDESIPYEHGYPLPAGGFYMDAFDIRSVDGRSFGAAGPSEAWFRLLAPVFAGEPITPLDRVLAMADFGNGISNIIEMGRHLYINPDLTVNVHRLPRGEWLLSDAVTHLRADGYGTATATLADADGLLGVANQSLLVVPAS